MTGDRPDVPAGDEDLLLPCGRDAAEVWDGATGSPDEHERTCSYCTAVRGERAQLDVASSAFLNHAGGGEAAPPRLLDSVMRVVSGELRAGRPLPLRTDAGRAAVSDVALGNALRVVLDDDPAFVPRRCSAERAHPDGSSDALRVWLSIAVSYEHYARHGDHLVRERVIDAVGRLFDLPVESVEIEIVDVFTGTPS